MNLRSVDVDNTSTCSFNSRFANLTCLFYLLRVIIHHMWLSPLAVSCNTYSCLALISHRFTPKKIYGRLVTGRLVNGAVHKVRHAIFGQFVPPSPLSHFVTHPGTPPKVRHTSRTPPIFRRPSTKH